MSLEVDSPRQPRHDRAALQEVIMLVRVRLTLGLALVATAIAAPCFAQEETEPQPGHTMRPVIIGRQYAVSSMKHQATEAAARILESGGNAFDAMVAGTGSAGAGQSRVERVRRRCGHPGLRREDETGVSINARRHGAQAGDDRLVQQQQRRQDSCQRRPACPPRCPASSMRGIYCSIAGAR